MYITTTYALNIKSWKLNSYPQNFNSFLTGIHRILIDEPSLIFFLASVKDSGFSTSPIFCQLTLLVLIKYKVSFSLVVLSVFLRYTYLNVFFFLWGVSSVWTIPEISRLNSYTSYITPCFIQGLIWVVGHLFIVVSRNLSSSFSFLSSSLILYLSCYFTFEDNIHPYLINRFEEQVKN